MDRTLWLCWAKALEAAEPFREFLQAIPLKTWLSRHDEAELMRQHHQLLDALGQRLNRLQHGMRLCAATPCTEARERSERWDYKRKTPNFPPNFRLNSLRVLGIGFRV
jgi:hypothetical protein